MPEIAIGRKEIMKARDHVGLFKIINQFKGIQRDRIKELILVYDIITPEDLIYLPDSKFTDIPGFGKTFLLRLKKVLIECGYKYDEETAEELSNKIAANSETSLESYKKLRFEILQRDGFRCQYCGRNPKSDPSVELQIDHIYPQSKGGESTTENLITSCRECNVGKSDVLLEESKCKT